MSSNDAGGTGKSDLTSAKTAADWFSKLRSKPIDSTLDKEFCDWLAENPENESEYERCELICELYKGLKDDPEITAYIEDCNDLITARRKKPGNIFTRWRKPAAIAAGFLALTVTMLLLLQAPSEERFITAVGEQRLIKLADGSDIMLNTDTELSVHYTNLQRDINIYRGEALFTVAKDANRPFIVHAASGLARAVGTKFNVLVDNNLITVSVLEGIVEVSPEPDIDPAIGNTTARLTEGQAVNYYDGLLAQTGSADLDRIEAWRAGKLDFDSARLADVVAEHNRYTKTKIIIADKSIKDLLVSGIFRVGENEPLLFALENSFNIRAVERGQVVMLIADRGLKTTPNAAPNTGAPIH